MSTTCERMVLLRIAKYYYLDGLSQQEISEKERIHRSQVSRLLKLAREQGYVQIRICPPNTHSSESLAKRLELGLGLQEALVAPAIENQADQDESFYFFTARWLETALQDKKNIGLGVGKTLYHVAMQLSPPVVENRPNFLSVAGSSGTNNSYLQASVILDNFARPFKGTCRYNNFPICITKEMMSPLDKNRFNELQNAYKLLDTVVLSIGGPFNVEYPYLEEFGLVEKEFDKTKVSSRPHGNILGHVFYDDGSVLRIPDRFLMTSMNLDLLVQHPNVICVAHGKEKTSAIIGAAQQRYIKSLVTDELTARDILDTLSV